MADSNKKITIDELKKTYGGGREEIIQRIVKAGLTREELMEVVGGSLRRKLYHRIREAGLTLDDLATLGDSASVGGVEGVPTMSELEAQYGGNRRQLLQRIISAGLTREELADITGGADMPPAVEQRIRRAGLSVAEVQELPA